MTAWRVRLAAIAACLVALHLGGEWSLGGIASHHFLADASMPKVSNAWVLFPVWRGETVLGSLTGMMIGVGAILPSIFALLFSAISFAVHRGVVPGVADAWRRLRDGRR